MEILEAVLKLGVLFAVVYFLFNCICSALTCGEKIKNAK